MTRALEVVLPGPLTTVQDAGRPGQAALGVGRSGACDRRAHALANRLVGNPPGAAALEVTFGGLEVRAHGDLLVATAGARCAGAWPHAAPARLRDGEVLRLGPPVTGVRTYVAVRGGVDVEPVLGSRSTDVLAALGPPGVLHRGERPGSHDLERPGHPRSSTNRTRTPGRSSAAGSRDRSKAASGVRPTSCQPPGDSRG